MGFQKGKLLWGKGIRTGGQPDGLDLPTAKKRAYSGQKFFLACWR
jgi:hypothetical protein